MIGFVSLFFHVLIQIVCFHCCCRVFPLLLTEYIQYIYEDGINLVYTGIYSQYILYENSIYAAYALYISCI